MKVHSDIFSGISTQEFLNHYWQKQVLFIPNAIPGFKCPISADELAGLACEESVESRIIMENVTDKSWALRYGPFTNSDFEQLPDTHWTLLVQECNKYVPELARLLDYFDFIPRWRVDDIMVSFAPRLGSVGPHTDQYDVFLLQGQGTKRWQISHSPVDPKNVIANSELQIMRSFSADEEWLLNPGDMLYLPPGVAHFGQAIENCLTLSVGFRAPSVSNILASFVESKICEYEDINPSPRYADPNLKRQIHTGEITPATLNQIKRILHHAVDDTDQVNRWFGRFITQSISLADDTIHPDLITQTQIIQRIRRKEPLIRSEYSKFAFINTANTCSLYVDGEEYELNPEIIDTMYILCDQSVYTLADLDPYLHSPAFLDLLTLLITQQKILFEDEQS